MIAGLFTCKYRAWSGEISLANKCHPVMTPSLIAPCAGSGIRIMLALRSVWGRSFASWPQDRLSADNGERRIYCMIRRNYKTKIWQDENTPRRKYDKTKTQDEIKSVFTVREISVQETCVKLWTPINPKRSTIQIWPKLTVGRRTKWQINWGYDWTKLATLLPSSCHHRRVEI